MNLSPRSPSPSVLNGTKGFMAFLATYGVLLMCAGLRAQTGGGYLMSFHSCDPAVAPCTGPSSHVVRLATSPDGASWTMVSGLAPSQGSVPDVVRRGDTLYVFTPNTVRRYSISQGVWTATTPVALTDPWTTGGFVDPSVYVDDQGRLVIFYLLGILGQNPAGCASGQATCTRYIHSATEVPGSDGTAFVAEPGHRIALTLGAPGTPPSASDPDIFFADGRYVCLLARGAAVEAYTSESLHGAYVPAASLPNGLLSPSGGAVASALHFHGSGETWVYGHAQQGGETVIRRAVTTHFNAPIPSSAWQTVVTGSSIGLGSGVHVESPGLARDIPQAATSTIFSQGCGSNIQAVTTSGPAEPGRTDFGLLVTGAPVGAPGWLVIGFSNTTWAGGPLPHSLGPTGCDLLVALDIMLPIIADATGDAFVTLPIPDDPALIGLEAYAQAGFVNGTSLSLSAGLAATMGLQ
ncbi:MAG: hypothetical protein HRU14_15890 [Planctomycetes bacterium]|nr:hypothetical protein [Planctomycetota bacterium]